MTHPAEQIIADAIISGDTETGLRQITCNAAASTKIFCECGSILDQRTVFVLEEIQDGKEKTIAACCESCASSHMVKLAALAKLGAKDGILYRWQTWHRTIPIEPIVNVEFVHVGETNNAATGTPVFKRTTARPAATKETPAPKKPAKPRIPSVWQIVRGKEQSERFRPIASEIVKRHGIALDSGRMIIVTGRRDLLPVIKIDDDAEKRVEIWAKRAKELLSQPIDESEELGPGDFVEINGDQCRRMIGKKTREHIATVNELFRRTAEKHGNVYRWFRTVAIGDHDTGAPQGIVGVNTAGERVAIIACVIDGGES